MTSKKGLIEQIVSYFASSDASLSSIASPTRAAGILHRDGIQAADKAIVPTLATKATAATGGALPDATTYYMAVAPGTLFGSAGASNVLSQATAADADHTHSITLTIPQVVGATYYDIFFSVDAAPKWIARITEAQRAAGGFQIQTYGIVTAGGGNAAGTILIGVVGTGIQTSNAVFAANNAYVVGAITGISCVGKSTAYVHVAFALTDLRSAPSLTLMPVFGSGETVEKQYTTAPITAWMMNGAVGQTQQQVFQIDVAGAAKLYVLIGSIAGQGGAASVWVELV